MKANIRFPEIFEVSPAQRPEREASEAEAAKTEDDAVKGAVDGPQSVHGLEEESRTPELAKEEETTSGINVPSASLIAVAYGL